MIRHKNRYDVDVLFLASAVDFAIELKKVAYLHCFLEK